jgi:predicted porin
MQSSPANNSNNQSYGVFYRNGPLVIGTALEYHHNQRGATTQTTVCTANCFFPLSDKAFSIAAKWQFSSFNIAGVYEKMNYEVLNGLGTVASPFAINHLKRNFWAVDTTINVGANGQVFLYWGHAGDGSGSATKHAATGHSAERCRPVEHLARGGSRAWRQHRCKPLGKSVYSYDLSKRTRVYTGYVKINNDANASYNFNINPYPGSANTVAGGPVGMGVTGFVMGMYHNF